MTAVDYSRVKQIFLAVCALPPSQRAAALEKQCAADLELRKEVEALLAHHRDESVLARQSLPKEEPRVVRVSFGRSAKKKWNDEQRKFLQQRIRVLVLVLHLVIALVLFRTYTFLDSWSRLPGVSKVGMLVGCVGLSSLSVVTLALRSPSFAWLRRLDLGLLAWAALVVCSFGYGWYSKGVRLASLAAVDLYERLADVYWAIAADQVTLLRGGPALLGIPVANYMTMVVGLYGVTLPNTVRRVVVIIFVTLLVNAAMIVAAAVANPVLRPYAVPNIVSSGFSILAACGLLSYIGLKFQALRRAVFDARQVGQYQLTRLLGKGAMGEVYLGRHRMLRRACAVKLIRAEQAGSDEVLRRFEREVQAMALLTHPNTVEIYDFGRTDDDSFFYAMEYLPGETLDALVRKSGPLPPGRVVYLLNQVCSALSEAHQKGLVHRDIKPGNIFVCERGGFYDVIKLLDFGLVHLQDPSQWVGDGAPPMVLPEARGEAALPPVEHSFGPSLTQTGQLLGTPAYMAPEQIEAQQPDARSDIYSLGGVACFLLSGRPPFERETISELYAAHVSGQVPHLREQLPDLPGDLEALIMRCLAKSPAARYQNVDEVAAALSAMSCSGTWNNAKAKAWWQSHPLTPDADALTLADEA